MPVESRRWSLEAAQQILGDIRERTGLAIGEVEERLATRQATEPGSAQRDALDTEIREIVSGWARAMEALGLVVKGPWLVDFDTGKGFFCWRWPEEELQFFHGNDEGFEGRVRIQ